MDDKMYVDLILKGDFDDGITQKFNGAMKGVEQKGKAIGKSVKDIEGELGKALGKFGGFDPGLTKILGKLGGSMGVVGILGGIAGIIGGIITKTNTYINQLTEINKKLSDQRLLEDEIENKRIALSNTTAELAEADYDRFERMKDFMYGQDIEFFKKGFYGTNIEQAAKTQEQEQRLFFDAFKEDLDNLNESQTVELYKLLEYTKQAAENQGMSLSFENLKNILLEQGTDLTKKENINNVLSNLVERILTPTLTEDQKKELIATTEDERNIFKEFQLITSENYEQIKNVMQEDLRANIENYNNNLYEGMSRIQDAYKLTDEEVFKAYRDLLGKKDTEGGYIQAFKALFGQEIKSKAEGEKILNEIVKYRTGGTELSTSQFILSTVKSKRLSIQDQKKLEEAILAEYGDVTFMEGANKVLNQTLDKALKGRYTTGLFKSQKARSITEVLDQYLELQGSSKQYAQALEDIYTNKAVYERLQGLGISSVLAPAEAKSKIERSTQNLEGLIENIFNEMIAKDISSSDFNLWKGSERSFYALFNQYRAQQAERMNITVNLQPNVSAMATEVTNF